MLANRRGIHIETLAVALKVPVSKLEALGVQQLRSALRHCFPASFGVQCVSHPQIGSGVRFIAAAPIPSSRLIPERTDINTPSRQRARHSSPPKARGILLVDRQCSIASGWGCRSFYWPAGYQPWDAWRTKQISGRRSCCPEPAPPDAGTVPVSAVAYFAICNDSKVNRCL